MTDTIDIAVVGAGSGLGEVLLELLAESELPLGTLHLLGGGEALGRRVAFRDHHLKIGDPLAFDFATVAISLFVGDAALTAEFAPRAAAAGNRVIDGSGALRDDSKVPLVVAELNPEALAGLAPGRIVATPAPASLIMLAALAPLHAAVGLTRVEVVSLAPVSASGSAGVEVLAGETAKLLNARPVTPELFPQQIAFNIIPQVGEADGDGSTAAELELARDARRLLAAPELELNASVLQVPVFFGQALVLHLETRDPLGRARAAELLAAAPGVELRLHEAPSAVADAANADKVFVGRLRSRPHRLELWVVADNLRRGAAVNCIQILQILVQEQL